MLVVLRAERLQPYSGQLEAGRDIEVVGHERRVHRRQSARCGRYSIRTGLAGSLGVRVNACAVVEKSHITTVTGDHREARKMPPGSLSRRDVLSTDVDNDSPTDEDRQNLAVAQAGRQRRPLPSRSHVCTHTLSAYHCHVTRVQMKTRPVPSSLARVVEELELRSPAVVTRSLLREIASHTETHLDADVLADRLVRLGWLLPLRKRDAWEFAPAARAGPYRSGDPWIELRALMAHEPQAPVAVAFESAVWELGHSSHQPAVPVVAHRRGWRAPRALDARTVTFDWRLPTRPLRGLPVWIESTIVVAAAYRPSAQGNWANADDWLADTFRAITRDDVITEARGRSVSTLARLGYLADWAGRDDIADQVEKLLPARLPVTFLGARDRRDRWNRRWHVYDAMLPDR